MTNLTKNRSVQTCPVFQLESAWGSISSPCKFPATPEDVSKNLWLRQWSPLNFKDDTQKAYYRYQPCLLETGTKLYYVVCLEPGISDYKYIGTHSWIALPPLNFLPPGCDRVIAGSAGNFWSPRLSSPCFRALFRSYLGIHHCMLLSAAITMVTFSQSADLQHTRTMSLP